MKQNQIVLIVAAVVLGIPILSCGGCLMLGMFVAAVAPAPLEEPNQPAETLTIESNDTLDSSPSQLSRVTMANFNRIRTGMTYQEVVSILGPPSEQNSQVEFSGQRAVMFTW